MTTEMHVTLTIIGCGVLYLIYEFIQDVRGERRQWPEYPKSSRTISSESPKTLLRSMLAWLRLNKQKPAKKKPEQTDNGTV